MKPSAVQKDEAIATDDNRLPSWADPNCGCCGGSGYTSLGGCYVCQKRAATRDSLGVEAQKERVYGWITGNQYQERGYYEGGKGKPNGEPWYKRPS